MEKGKTGFLLIPSVEYQEGKIIGITTINNREDLSRLTKTELIDFACLLINRTAGGALEFTMNDLRGPWAEDAAKCNILQQLNKKIGEHYHFTI